MRVCPGCDAGLSLGAFVTDDGRGFCPNCSTPIPAVPLEIHTIPVPRGWSVEQAWEAIRRGALLTDPEPQGWANIEVRDGSMLRVLPAGE